MPDSHAIVLTLQRYTIFRGLTYLIYAGLWLYYMQGLLHSSTTDQYCRDVQPTLRTVLLVISWIKLVVSIVFVCFVLSNVLLKPSVEQFALLLAMVVILGIFLYQIQFLNAVEASNAKTGDCDEVETHKRRMVYVFTVVIFVFGVFLVAFGLTGGSFLDTMVNAAQEARKRTSGLLK